MASDDALALESQAAAELAAGRPDVAFRLADRRCRLPLPAHPHCFVMRAEALHRRGFDLWALDDIRQALRIAPDDIAANRRMMIWTQGPERTEAALVLARHDPDVATQREALDHLRSAGPTAVGDLTVVDRVITGWAAWDGELPLDVSVTDDIGITAWQIAPDPDHPLRGRGCAASFELPRPATCSTQSIELAWTGGVLAAVRSASTTKPQRSAVPDPGPAAEDRVTVIIPVYGDAAATRACLDSVLDALDAAPESRLIVVDDASPDPEVRDVLDGADRRDRVTVLVNRRNLGFVGSINRALAHVDVGDVLLLNADTLVPPRLLSALKEVARSAPHIGTVTPLSNNGEFTSFPLPNAVNPLPTMADIVDLDALAARCNAGVVVDLPSGIGFCLYITRACLSAVGPLSEDYHRGYLEDADFCLRARDLGFRNVGAAAVFVGHAGGRSFAQDKRALVVRNLAVLERRFPNHRAECAAFMAADPLRAARAAIECALPSPGLRPVVLLASRGPMAEIAADRARQIAETGAAAILVEVRNGFGPTSISIIDPAGRAPQSMQIDIDAAAAETACGRSLAELAPSRIEILDLLACPDALLRILLDLRCPLDLYATTSQLIALLVGEAACDLPMRWTLRPVPHFPRADANPQRMTLLRQVIGAAERIIAPEGVPELCLRDLDVQPDTVGAPHAPVDVPVGAVWGRAVHLGIVPVCRTWREQALIEALAAGLAAIRPDVPLTVLGAVADDEALMRAGHVYVTGRIEEPDLDRVMEAYGIGQVLLALDRPLFGHPTVRRVRACGLPVAAADWSAGTAPARPADLAIDPSGSMERTVQRIAAWVPPATAARLAMAG